MTAHRTPTGALDLRSLDPAPTRGDRATSPAAQQLLLRVLSTPRPPLAQPSSPAPSHIVRARRSPLPRRRWLLAAGALVAGAVLVPTGHGGSGAAFASWTPVPAALPAVEAAAAQAECLAAGPDPAGTVTAAVSERRGDYAFTLVATDRAVGSCLLLDATPTGPDGQQEQGAISWGPADQLPLPSALGITVQRGATYSSAAGSYTSAAGRVGADVVAVQIAPAGEQSVQASVADGFFIAWWPGELNDHLAVTTTREDGSQATRTVEAGDY